MSRGFGFAWVWLAARFTEVLAVLRSLPTNRTERILAETAGRLWIKENKHVEPLGISNVEPDESDLSAQTFVMRLTRTMTVFEQQTLPELLSEKFAPSELRDRANVTIKNANIGVFEKQEVRDMLKGIVTEAEALAETRQSEQDAAEAAKTAKVEDAKRRADQIDWD